MPCQGRRAHHRHLLRGGKVDWPLPATALRTLADGTTALYRLAPNLVDVAAPILGKIGFAAGMARPDANFYSAFCVLSHYAGTARLTTYVFRRIVCLG